MLVIFRGLPGTGKSYLVRQLVEKRPSFRIVSRDALRTAVLPRPTFSAEEKALIDDLVCAVTAFLLDRGTDVVIDGMALSSAARVDQLVQIAVTRGIPARIVECVCSQETALSRIAADGARHPAGDRGETLYFEVKARFQPVMHPCLAVDTDRATAANVAAILDYLSTGIPSEPAPAESASEPVDEQ